MQCTQRGKDANIHLVHMQISHGEWAPSEGKYLYLAQGYFVHEFLFHKNFYFSYDLVMISQRVYITENFIPHLLKSETFQQFKILLISIDGLIFIHFSFFFLL